MSIRDLLSVPTTTVNFRRLINRVGSVFWLQDIIEEIITRRKGRKVTVLWMAIHTFLCFYSQSMILLPNTIILDIIIASHPQRGSPGTGTFTIEQIQPSTSYCVPKSAKAEWLANVQCIRNLIGAVADHQNVGFPYLLRLTLSTPSTPHIFSIIFSSTLLALPFLSLVPLRPLFLIGSLIPFAVTNPFIQHTFLLIVLTLPLCSSRVRLVRSIDNDVLKDFHSHSELREVELFENEPWVLDEETG